MINLKNLNYSQYIEENIRKIPNWPSPGILFQDITPLLHDATSFRILIDIFTHRYINQQVDYVAGLDARGFIIGAALAYQLSAGFIPIRKKGKLPFDTISETYELEYGNATVEIHTDAVKKGDRVVLIDDLIATGGTMLAGAKLLEKLEATIVETAAILEFSDLDGGKKIRDAKLPIFTICQLSGTL